MTAAGAPYGAELTVEVAGRTLQLSSLDRPVWPPLGWTKGELIDYYVRVAPVLLPHVAGRPLTLRRYPAGVGGPHFYQLRAVAPPPWLRTVTVPGSGDGGSYPAPVVDDLAGLAWAGNLMAVELHPGLARAAALDVPTMLVCDLDPVPPAGLLEAADAALLVRAALEDGGLPSYAKTSGSRGVHVVVPLAPQQTYEAVRAFARALAERLVAAHPERFAAKVARRTRKGLVVLDWEENAAGASLVAPYSLRALVTPTVSTPVRWDEVAEAVYRSDARALLFSPEAVLERIERFGDLFAAVQQVGLALPDDRQGGDAEKAEGKASR